MLHVGDARRPLAVPAGARATRRCSTSTGREMHKSWGNTIELKDAFDANGRGRDALASTARSRRPHLRFGYGPAHEIKRRLLTFWNSVKFLVDYGNIEGFAPEAARADREPQPLDRWLVERTEQLVADATAAYERCWTVGVVARLRGIRRRRLELVHPPVPPALLGRRRRPRSRTLWYALSQSLRVIAPVMPFLTDHLWRNLVGGGPASVHLAGWPELREPDDGAARRDRRGSARGRARPAGALRRRGSSCASRCVGSSPKVRRSPRRTQTRSPTSCA